MSVIEELAAEIRAGLAEDERLARAADDEPWKVGSTTEPYWGRAGQQEPGTMVIENGQIYPQAVTVRGSHVAGRGMVCEMVRGRHEVNAEHIVRQQPRRTLAEVASTRALVDALLAEPHEAVEGDTWYACSQARDADGDLTCADDGRRGEPCDCGRDDRVLRYLELLAQPYRTETT